MNDETSSIKHAHGIEGDKTVVHGSGAEWQSGRVGVKLSSWSVTLY